MPLLSFFIALSACIVLVFAESFSTDPFDEQPALHLPIYRRGGSFETFDPGNETASLTGLAAELIKTRQRYDLTHRVINGNKLVRKAKRSEDVGKDNDVLMSEVEVDGRWFTKIKLGQPPQELEVELDMLSSDFYVLTTTSGKGSRYDDIFSKSFARSPRKPFPICTLPAETFQFPGSSTQISLQFPYCRPSKSSSSTLGDSGSVLGLAPSRHMAQIDTQTLVSQLVEKEVIKRPVFSLMLINNHEGILSLGGTTASAIEKIQRRANEALGQLGSNNDDKKLDKRRIGDVSRGMNWVDHWKWSHVQGADGWWQILMPGVWVEGRKVLKNQPVVLDINTPFILAPPAAAHTFYSSISGAQPLPAPYNGFYSFPCLNPPNVALEFAGWNFPAFKGTKGTDHLGRESWSRPGGRFSLGRLEPGSGFCVGAVVGYDLSTGDDSVAVTTTEKLRRRARQEVDGNGMGGVWVIGEPWFRGTSCVFDYKEQSVGMRST